MDLLQRWVRWRGIDVVESDGMVDIGLWMEVHFVNLGLIQEWVILTVCCTLEGLIRRELLYTATPPLFRRRGVCCCRHCVDAADVEKA